MTRQPRTSAHRPVWKSLTVDQIRQLELQFCNWESRANVSRGTKTPSERCGKLLKKIFDASNQMRGGKVNQYELGAVVGRSGTDVSRFFNGERPLDWIDCRNMLTATLLGAPVPDALDEGKDAHVAARELKLTLFGEEKDGPGPFFSSGSAAPQTLREARYEPLWLARKRFLGSADAQMLVVSGGSAYHSAKSNSELAEGGKAAVCAALAGVRVVLVFPDERVGPTEARDGARKFYSAARATCMGGTSSLPPHLKHLMSEREYDLLTPSRCHKLLARNVKRVPLDPFREEVLDNPDRPGRRIHLWAGEFLNRVLRFVYLTQGASRLLFISREGTQVPFSYETSDEEREAFEQWLRLFLPGCCPAPITTKKNGR